jgi:hypothetical protein
LIIMEKNIVSRRVTRFFASLLVSIGLFGTAALGLAATADASDSAGTPLGPGTGSMRGPAIVATPNTSAKQWVPPVNRFPQVR